MKKTRLVAVAFALALALCALPSLAFAAGGDGSGGGGGNGSGGGNAPTLTASQPADGATITTDESTGLWVQFSNNVAEPVVSTGNIEKVHLQKADGTVIAASVTVADTQTDPDKRQYIYIAPEKKLEAGSYVIAIDSGIKAKNGASNDTEYRVSFTVKDSFPTIPVVIGAVIAIAAIIAFFAVRSRKSSPGSAADSPEAVSE